jgi:chemotaxis protein CheX
LRADFVNPFLTSLLNVMQTMAQTHLTPGKPRLKTDQRACGDVSGLIGMVGPQTKGSFSITFERELALKIFQRMLGSPADSINEEVTDMVGEITNMVTGGAKRLLGERGYEFDMATPAVVSGPDHTISHKVDGGRILMPFSSPDGKAYIEICFED